jgi:hypothetical protein
MLRTTRTSGVKLLRDGAQTMRFDRAQLKTEGPELTIFLNTGQPYVKYNRTLFDH